ncbi:hypothetical protein PoB_000052300 [Plakobranchus ocellatus]|uniref:Uncharacterized protein n=1 Tax=Plakobranchus ocellatus TaxID=259542 RepID=A0AAV3XVK9_9GAST|nr:hypothetical protein PoB_000052300 [Plakobranchus ocellatus]
MLRFVKKGKEDNRGNVGGRMRIRIKEGSRIEQINKDAIQRNSEANARMEMLLKLTKRKWSYSALAHCGNITLISLLQWGEGFVRAGVPQQDDLMLSGPPAGQGAGGGARTRD